MKYILLIYGDERVWADLSREEMMKVYEGHGAYDKALKEAGVYVTGSELKPVGTATSVRFANGSRPKTIDGPFAETKEQLAGFYIIDVSDLDQAIAWAEKMPGMTAGTVEVRPLAEG